MITKNEISSLNLSPTKKDFVQIWNELIEVASKITERWDPTSTNESDPGIVLLKVLAGIADKLNYNIDKNILEAYMPTAAQMESMRKLCELVGYDIKYYQSAETTVRISYTGNTTDTSEGNDERIEGFGLPISKFTTITNADKDVTFLTTNDLPLYITNSTPWVDVPCIEGQISQCESVNENNLITLAQLDDDNRYYLPEVQIAENGIFVYNAALKASSATLEDGTRWQQVSNLNVQPPDTRVYKFGYDSLEGRPYLAFPNDVGSLIEDGLFIYFVRTSGLSGNISPNTLEMLEIPAGDTWSKYSAEQFEVVNVDAAMNGANIESISAAYNNFKKTVGTFDTLITCRDYMNKIYSLMDVNNVPYVSNILVTDIRNDINNAITLCSYNEYGILYKELPLLKANGDTTIDHFDLLLYPFKTFTKVSSGTKKLAAHYNESFKYTEQMNLEIETSLAELKTCAHNFVKPTTGDIIAINNYLQLNALIATSARVTEAEAKDILKNIKVALINEFNLRNLDFGEEIPFDSILTVIENADARIKVVSLQEPTLLTTYSVKDYELDGNVSIATSKEYGIASSESDVLIGHAEYADTAKEIYNKLVLRNILAGRAALFDYDETFLASNAEKPYLVTKDITAWLEEQLTESDTTATTIKAAIDTITQDSGEYILINSDGNPIIGPNTGTLTLKKITGNTFKLYETYEYDFVLEAQRQPAEPDPDDNGSAESGEDETTDSTDIESYETVEGSDEGVTGSDEGVAGSVVATATSSSSNGIIKDIAKIEAVCEIESATNTFNNITLAKNEVVKFRAPNLVTTQTFPAYVYYRYEKATNTSGESATSAGGSSGRAAVVESLIDFINNDFRGFFTTFWSKDYIVSKLNYFDFLKNPNGQSDQTKRLSSVLQSSIAIGLDLTATGKPTYTLVFSEEGTLTNFFTCLATAENSQSIKDYLIGLGYSIDDAYINELASQTKLTFKYYPLMGGTIPLWSKFIRECYKLSGTYLPGSTTLWRLSSTYSHVPGRLVTESGQKLYAQSGDFLANQSVGEITYICTDLGEDAKFSNMPDKSDVQLEEGDKLYIHYTPSSTNEDGETVNAEPVFKVYEGGDLDDPIILKPSGFTLIPSDKVNANQGVSWKKTDVEFPGYGPKNLLALAPNEQIELRSISRVILDTPARFYKNFDNVALETGSTEPYELKDGEYIFYTNQNTQEAAYYGSGSVITLKGGAYIPKTSQIKEISDILTEGLHIIPWSNIVLLNDSKTITVTEYQYITLTDGDTIEQLVIDGDQQNSTKLDGAWKKCTSALYRLAGAETATKLTTLELDPSISPGWEVCSRLELATLPGYAQTLRANTSVTVGTTAGETLQGTTTSITNKLNIYQSSGAFISDPIVITPQMTDNPALGAGEPVLINKKPVVDEQNNQILQTVYEPVSIKVDTAVYSASGNFVPEADEDVNSAKAPTVQMKVFKESVPEIIELDSVNDIITPISAVTKAPLESSSNSINNYWTKLDPSVTLFKDNSSTSADPTAKTPRAISLNFDIPEEHDLFGIFSIYLETTAPLTNAIPDAGYRVFIDLPTEFGVYNEVISIFNYKDTQGQDSWWQHGMDATNNRLYLRAGLNCIKVSKSCNLFIKAEPNVTGNILYDNLRLVRGRATNGVNLRLLDYNVRSLNSDVDSMTDEETAQAILDQIAALDPNHDFYYNVSIENSLAIEFDENISTFSNPHTLYDINNINNSFVISKLDVDYLDTGLRIAKSSKYKGINEI